MIGVGRETREGRIHAFCNGVEYAVHASSAQQCRDPHVFLANGSRADDGDLVGRFGLPVDVLVLTEYVALRRAFLEETQSRFIVFFHRMFPSACAPSFMAAA